MVSYSYWDHESHFLRDQEDCIFCSHDRRQWEHDRVCYGKDCFSCGCSSERGPCNSHKGSTRYANELKLREVLALEAIAKNTEKDNGTN